MENLDEYLDSKVIKGYVYFIYSNIVNKVYIGETTSINRIKIYNSIIEEKDSKIKIRLYNYYTKNYKILFLHRFS